MARKPVADALIEIRDHSIEVIRLSQMYQISLRQAQKIERLSEQSRKNAQYLLDVLARTGDVIKPPSSPSPSPHAEGPGNATPRE